uniref:Uncharacterized protein n=1 Tax=Anguilla anguilla TaxID=7936 RepID=A0A0E9X2W3_ANGAN
MPLSLVRNIYLQLNRTVAYAAVWTFIIFQKCVFTHVNGQMWSTVELPLNMSASVCYHTVCYSAALFSIQSIFKDLCNFILFLKIFSCN